MEGGASPAQAETGGAPPPPPAAVPVETQLFSGGGGGGDGGGGGGGGVVLMMGQQGMVGSESEHVLVARRKRGRPRKYSGGGGGGEMGVSLSPAAAWMASPEFSPKRGKGRPPGSGQRQLLSSLGEWFAYSAGGNFTPHVVTIAAGEDVAKRIFSFSQKGPRAICILSANGAISNVTLRQPGSNGGTLTYEGRFEILSLTGSFTVTEDGGVRGRTGGISVSLAGPDGRVVGGGVAGLLLAASPIQVVVGSFLPQATKENRRPSNPETLNFSAAPNPSGVLTSARPISQMNPDEDCETPTSVPGQSHGDSENNMSTNPNSSSIASFRTGTWHGLQQSSSEHKPSPDINVSLPGESHET